MTASHSSFIVVPRLQPNMTENSKSNKLSFISKGMIEPSFASYAVFGQGSREEWFSPKDISSGPGVLRSLGAGTCAAEKLTRAHTKIIASWFLTDISYR